MTNIFLVQRNKTKQKIKLVWKKVKSYIGLTYFLKCFLWGSFRFLCWELKKIQIFQLTFVFSFAIKLRGVYFVIMAN